MCQNVKDRFQLQSPTRNSCSLTISTNLQGQQSPLSIWTLFKAERSWNAIQTVLASLFPFKCNHRLRKKTQWHHSGQTKTFNLWTLMTSNRKDWAIQMKIEPSNLQKVIKTWSSQESSLRFNLTSKTLTTPSAPWSRTLSPKTIKLKKDVTIWMILKKNLVAFFLNANSVSFRQHSQATRIIPFHKIWSKKWRLIMLTTKLPRTSMLFIQPRCCRKEPAVPVSVEKDQLDKEETLLTKIKWREVKIKTAQCCRVLEGKM